MRTWICSILLMTLIAGTGLADDVVLKNGEHVKGTITALSDGKMTVTSETMGDVTIPLAEVLTFSTEAPIELHFMDKSVFNQKVSASKDGWIGVPVGPDESVQQFKIADIDKVNPPKSKWKGNLAVGMSATRGNTYTQGGTATLTAVRRTETDRISFDAAYASQRQKDPDTDQLKTTQRQSSAGLQYDYFFTEKVYGYANARAERDAIAKIEMRMLSGAGVGWQVYESDDFNFLAETGISWISEGYLPPDPGDPVTDDESYFSARVAYKTDAKLNDSVSFFHNATAYPAFESAGGYYVTADGGFRSSLTDSMFAEIKALWAWDSTPAERKKRVDVTYLLSIGWTF
ncbi:MAG: DUF481 domain-containing protein [Planctomycetes bacterium]|nr:DUF481 domain-containing protein [Planctomycetota bacterium]